MESEGIWRQYHRLGYTGDASLHGSGQSIDASNSLLLAPFDVGVAGWAARKWLDQSTLVRLKNLGVGTLYWSVGAKHKEAAMTHARELIKQGITAVEVLAKPSPLPPLVLTASPANASSASLRDILIALGVEASLEGLNTLWKEAPGQTPDLPRLRKGEAASFLIVSPAPGGQIDFESTILETVWLDGHG